MLTARSSKRDRRRRAFIKGEEPSDTDDTDTESLVVTPVSSAKCASKSAASKSHSAGEKIPSTTSGLDTTLERQLKCMRNRTASVELVPLAQEAASGGKKARRHIEPELMDFDLDERGGAKDTEHDGDIQKVRLNVSIE
jgi:hypothetical protein